VKLLPERRHVSWSRARQGYYAVLLAAVLAFPVCGRAQEKTPLYPPGGITPEAVRQGGLGSCYFHSVVAALAATDAQAIRKMIEANSDGSYTVHFADGGKETAYPPDILFARQSGYDLSEGLWVAVLFRAYAQRVLREALIASVDKSDLFPLAKKYAADFLRTNDALLLAYDRAIRSQVDASGNLDRATLAAKLKSQMDPVPVPDSVKSALAGLVESGPLFGSIVEMVKENGELFGAYRAVGHGGLGERVMKALVGSSRLVPNQSPEEASAELAQAASQHRPLVACTGGSQYYQRIAAHQTLPPGVGRWYINAHCYTVLGFDASAGSVRLRNPWGQGPTPNGIFDLPLNDFIPAFQGIVTTD
jgi:hypothetical protein